MIKWTLDDFCRIRYLAYPTRSCLTALRTPVGHADQFHDLVGSSCELGHHLWCGPCRAMRAYGFIPPMASPRAPWILRENTVLTFSNQWGLKSWNIRPAEKDCCSALMIIRPVYQTSTELYWLADQANWKPTTHGEWLWEMQMGRFWKWEWDTCNSYLLLYMLKLWRQWGVWNMLHINRFKKE